MTARGLIRKLEAINVASIVVESVEDTEKDFIEANTTGQLLFGIDKNDQRITPGYKSKYYAKKKALINPLPGLGTPDLKVSGNFYDKMRIKVNRENIEISSGVDYAKRLEENYGDSIYGLNDKQRPAYIFGPFFNAFKNKFESFTGLKLK